jgi:hypothetical protein
VKKETSMQNDNWIRNALSVADAGNGDRFVLTTAYPESDALNPAGQVLLHSAANGETHSILSTGSPLAAMWRSREGDLWLGSADGSAWTTAKAIWPTAGPLFDETGVHRTWSTTWLPPLTGGRGAPNVTAIWGASNSDVFFATASGDIYRWDGRDWRQWAAAAASLTKLDGNVPGNAYAVGYRGTIVHWNGQDWLPLGAPELDIAITIVTGVAVLEDGSAFAVTNRGELLALHASGAVVVEKVKETRFMGLVTWKGGLVAASSSGAWLFKGRNLQHIKGNFAATDVQAVDERLYFIETDQPDGPACIEYFDGRDAADGSPWQRVVF